MHTAVDTSGYAPPDVIAKIIPYTNLFLFDLKHLDPLKHLEFTGVSNELIISNLALILDSGNEVRLRIPVIPGFNDHPEHLAALREFISARTGSSLKMVNLLPYHKTGTSKYLKFNRLNRMEGVRHPDQEHMKHLKEYFSSTGVKIKIGG
jgi:pyruvate formate lyase activating enzyme